MRLKTRMIMIGSVVVLIAAFVCSVAAFYTIKTGFLDTAMSQGFQNAANGFSVIEKKVTALQLDDNKMEENIMEYIMKDALVDMQGGILACFYKKDSGETVSIYNDTFFDSEDLEKLSYQNVSVDVEQAKLKLKQQYFLVYRIQKYTGYDIYKLEDITYVLKRQNMLGAGLAACTLGTTVLACMLLSFMMNKALYPLQELNISAKQIACGRYDQRIMVERKDEIGELSNNFNQMAEAVELRTNRLEESERKKTLFMANLTHELKTPLTAISGYAKTLLTVKLSDEDKEEALSFIYGESCRLERLSKKMMELLLLEKEEHIVRKKIPVMELFDNAQAICSERLAGHHIELEYHENGEYFYVDKDLFVEVLVNLIDNSIKASQEGGKILLLAEEHSIIVQDFGKGIPVQEQEKILEPFYMIDKSRSRQNGGAGLGLAIAAMILKRHGCQLRIESTEGKGTRMILQFV